MKCYKLTEHGILHNVYCVVYAMCFVYAAAIGKALDWFGKKLVYLIDNSDFFAGCVTTAAVISLWELIVG